MYGKLIAFTIQSFYRYSILQSYFTSQSPYKHFIMRAVCPIFKMADFTAKRSILPSFLVKFLSIFVHISASIGPITPIWVSLERSFPPAEVEYSWWQFWSKAMSSEEVQRPRLVTGGYGRHESQWVKGQTPGKVPGCKGDFPCLISPSTGKFCPPVWWKPWVTFV